MDSNKHKQHGLAPLSNVEVVRLNQALLDLGGISVFELHGLLCAIHSVDKQYPISHWLLPALRNQPTNLKSLEERIVLGLSVRLSAQIQKELKKEADEFYPLFNTEEQPYSESSVENHIGNIFLWCEGYAKGIRLDYKLWSFGEDTMLKDMAYPIVLLSEYQYPSRPNSSNGSNQTIDPLFIKSAMMLPTTIPQIYTFWKVFSQELTSIIMQRSNLSSSEN